MVASGNAKPEKVIVSPGSAGSGLTAIVGVILILDKRDARAPLIVNEVLNVLDLFPSSSSA
jgi:hypothetical protein